jgi:hypothetical protein
MLIRLFPTSSGQYDHREIEACLVLPSSLLTPKFPGESLGQGPHSSEKILSSCLAGKQQEAIFRSNMGDSSLTSRSFSKAKDDVSQDIAANLFLAKSILAPLIVCQLPNMQVYFQGHVLFGATAIQLEKLLEAFLPSAVQFQSMTPS